MPSGALSCPICYNDYDQGTHVPRVIQECGHTVCTMCLSILLMSQKSTAKCPLDNRKFSSLEKTIDAFPVNFTIHQLLDEKASRDLCTSHNDKLRLVCIDDRTEICDECVFNGGHKGHNVLPIKKLQHYAGQKKVELEGFLKDQDKCRQDIKEVVEEKRTNLLNVIKEKFQEIRWLINKKELELSFEVNSLFDIEYTTVCNSVGLSQEAVDDIKKRIQTLDGVSTPKDYFTALEKGLFQEIKKTEGDVISEQCQELNIKLNKITCQLHEKLILQGASITNVELSIGSLFRDLFQNSTEKAGASYQGYEEEILSRLNKVVKTEFEEGWFVVSTEKAAHRGSNRIKIGSSESESQEKIWLKLGARETMSECVQVLAKVWKTFKRVNSVKIELISNEITDQELLGVFAIVFGDTFRLQDVTVNLSDCRISDESIVPLFEHILPKMSGLKRLTINLNATNITNRSLVSFNTYMKPTTRVLEVFDIRLCDVKLADQSISQLFTRMDRVKKFTVDLGYTHITDESLFNLAAITLPSMKVLEEFKLGLANTNVTDDGVSQVLSEIRNTKSLLMYLPGTRISDKSLHFFADVTLPALPSLEVLEMRLGETRISDQSMIHLLNNNLKNLKKFRLKLQSTKVSDKTAEKLIYTAYPEMKNLEEFEIDISGTDISEEFALQFVRMKRRCSV